MKQDAFGAQKERLGRLRRLVRAHGCDALLVTNPVDIRYLTTFRGEDSALLVEARRATVLSDFRFQEELGALRGLADVVIRSEPMADAMARLVKARDVRRLGVQAERMTLGERAGLARLVGAKRLVETTGLLASLRVCKDGGEVAAIRRAVRIQEAALEATLEAVRPGLTEAQVCARLEFEMKARGAEGSSFGSIVAARANSSLPHAVAGATKLRRNDVLLIDWGARAHGYCSDMTRTFALGRWPREMARVYDVVLEAMEAGITAVGPGVAARDVDRAARSVIEKAGYGERFGHGLGHGIGLDIHEAPRVAKTSEDTLAAGMVVTIEPGVYLPGVGGVRIEDDVLVTDRGRRVLSTMSRERDWATR